ncbi:MAG: HDIG domain-containing protein [Bacillota bacterium]|nr:HDIG domain-containing protein [Bacillota bacterium]
MTERKPSIVVKLAVLLLAYLISLGFVYVNSRPRRYVLELGQVSLVDIAAQKELPDVTATEQRARLAAARTARVLNRSGEISEAALERLSSFFDIAAEIRQDLVDETRQIIDQVPRATTAETTLPSTEAETEPSVTRPGTAGGGISAQEAAGTVEIREPATPNADDTALFFSQTQLNRAAERLQDDSRHRLNALIERDDAAILVGLNGSIFASIRHQTEDIAKQIMDEGHDTTSLASAIATRGSELVQSVEFYRSEFSLVGRLLTLFLEPNLVYDAAASEAAREAEYNRALESPVMIPQGTRIVSVGETITPEIMERLEYLDLIESNETDWRHLLAITTLLLFVMVLTIFYINYARTPERKLSGGDELAILITMMLTILLSSWTARFSVLAVPISYVAIILGVYFGLRISVGLSILTMLAILPLCYQDPSALFVHTASTIVMALLASSYHKKDSQARLIVAAALSGAGAAALYGMLQKHGIFTVGQNALYSGLTGGLAAVAAVGSMPIFESFLSQVSPMRLIQLAQPGQPLLRRLFLEAPGSNQHSMMVANLGEAAADAIGADSLLVRVGAYYHDIGKLEHPEMFTENQTDYNPHDRLLPEESVRFIIGHVENGLRIAKRYRLPQPIQAIITEHHGNQLQVSFYHQAKKMAEERGEEPPEIRHFRYPWHGPRTRESAIVSICDALEAAVRSTRTNTVQGVEELARRIVKHKIEQDQMTASGLSFADVEAIIRACMQVYQGQFHERVRYPDEADDHEPPAEDSGRQTEGRESGGRGRFGRGVGARGRGRAASGTGGA